ncbi:hypothetical protein BDV41DRAFT_517465 [Aspergillus transmontanensis]|uniref:Uncharacterized protein n=1 Tax=Aspergillus transmontanensis TaxID=1034304 RepID=A0A5N6WHJ0_9EURO|nr:hypothetical protein BDV41DRAFT_517465 [Aspergillus transmontanensis]
MVSHREHYYFAISALFSTIYIFSNSYHYGLVSQQGIRGVKLDVVYSEMVQCQNNKQVRDALANLRA